MIGLTEVIAEVFIGKGIEKLITITKRDFEERLTGIFNKSISEFEKIQPPKTTNQFYKYQDVQEALLKFSFFGEFDRQLLADTIKKNQSSSQPTENELRDFVDIFFANIKADTKLRKLELNERGLAIIVQRTDTIIETVTEIKNDVKKLSNVKLELPHCLTSIPHSMTENVFGREEDLNDLQNLLNNNSTVLVVNGMGGIGKSTLAQKYVQLHKNEYNHIAFIEVGTEFENNGTGDDKTTFLSAFVESKDNSLIQNLGISFEDKTPLEERFLIMMNILRNISGNNLLVIDNTSDVVTQFVDYLPSPPNWKVLVTSRQKMSVFVEHELDKLKPEPARELFYKHYKIEKNDRLVDKILEFIERHTLTIELLARTFNDSNTKLTGIEEVIEKEGLDFRNKVKVKSPHVKAEHGEYLFEHLLETFVVNINAECKDILRSFSVLPSFNIEYSDLKQLYGIEDKMESSFLENINHLAKTGWLIKDEQNCAYRCHQIIQEVCRKQLTPDEVNCEKLIDSLTDLLRVDQAKDNPVEKFKWIGYGRTVVNYFGIGIKSISTLANNLALMCQNNGYYEEAKELMKKALDSDIKNFGEDHPSTAIRRSNLALILQDLNELNEAKELMKKALDSDIKNFGENHPTTAIRGSNLAMILRDLGELNESKELLVATLTIHQYQYPDGHPYIAQAQSNLATILRDLGELSEARELMQKALDSDIKNFGEDHPSTAISRSILAMIIGDLGELNKAKGLMQKALDSDIKNFGEDHPTTARRRSNLAMILGDLGELNEAKELMKEALSSDIKNFDEDHPSTARSRSNLATILQDLGELNEAKELMKKALFSYIKNFGEDHPFTARSRSNLALILQDLGELNEAKELMKKALSSDNKNFGEDHPSVAIRHSNLALILQALGELNEAKELITLAYVFYRNKFGDEHYQTKIVKSNLEVILKEIEQQEKN